MDGIIPPDKRERIGAGAEPYCGDLRRLGTYYADVA
jgi:hypothetical protein